MRKVFASFLFLFFLAPLASPIESEPSLQKAMPLLQSFLQRVDGEQLLGRPDEVLRKLGAKYDADNQLFYLEYRRDIKDIDETLVEIEPVSSNRVNFRIFPPGESYQPYYLGALHLHKNAIVCRGILSDGSEPSVLILSHDSGN